MIHRTLGFVVSGVFLLAACGSLESTSSQPTRSSGVDDAGSSGGGDGGSESDASRKPITAREPKSHRLAPTTCDDARPSPPPDAPDGGPAGSCHTHEECIAGRNGRCLNSGREGWRCTYDACRADSDCAGGQGLCECEGGFGSDHNVCLDTGCHADADCPATIPGRATGFCSPSLGSCGNYGKSVGYYCHTAEDECIDDSDCPSSALPGYCRYQPEVARWTCSTSMCVG
jgi:hypothetical protein